MHTVSKPPRQRPVTVKDCEHREIVIFGGRYFQVIKAGCLECAFSLDSDKFLTLSDEVTRPPTGTVITIVVGGEKSETEKNVEACLDYAEQNAGKPLYEWDKARIYDCDTQRFSRPQSDAEFLDSLRGRGIRYSISSFVSGAAKYCVSLTQVGRETTYKNVDTFAEAAEWLRGQVE